MDERTPIINKNKGKDMQLNIMDDSKKDDFFPDNPFRETFDQQFWTDVSDINKTEENWSAALLKCRLNRLKDRCEEIDKDIILYFMEIYDRYAEIARQRNETDYLLSFIQQLSEFVCEVLIEDYEKNKKKKRTIYSIPIEVNDEIEKTVLHFAAERNLDAIATTILNFYPRLCYCKCPCGGPIDQLPIELAIENNMDNTASLLAKKMNNASVRALFEYDEVAKKAKYSFSAMARDERMKKTVIEVLDCLINPEFPFIPNNPDEKAEDSWSKIPNKPQRYHVYYRLLDGDQNGRSPYKQDGTVNPDFDHRSHSGLFSIAHSPFSQDIIIHPVVRLLVQRKWEKYGAMWIWIRIMMYLLFLISMTVALFIPVKDGDRKSYETDKDYIRMGFEIFTYVMTIYYAVMEIDQMSKERKIYWIQPFNYFDLAGILLVLSLLPIKFIESSGQRSQIEYSVAAVAYLVNVFRIFQWFPAIRNLGIFIVLIQRLVTHDLPKFLAVYCVIIGAFTGSIVLALKAYGDGFSKAGIDSWGVLLKEVRALVETNPFADDYIGSYRTAIIVLLMLNMFACILILANILIANLSNAYTDAQLMADLQCSIDRTTVVSRLEYSWVGHHPKLPKMLSNHRLMFYVDAAYVGNVKEVTEMISNWEERKIEALK